MNINVGFSPLKTQIYQQQLSRDRYPVKIAQFLGEVSWKIAMPSGTDGTQGKMVWCEHKEIPSGGLRGRATRPQPEQEKKKMMDAMKWL